ncbi:MAG TPA: ABC transporter ATP-binding protein [Polyangiaceae bacterium]|nr:ABC transporter ATP-binding protein [Polyangiaceae bacterium]
MAASKIQADPLSTADRLPEIRGSWDLARRLWRYLPHRGVVGLTIGASAVIYGAAHGAVALCAGFLGKALVQPAQPAWLTTILFVGLGAAVVKAVSGVSLAYSQVYAARGSGQGLREASAERLLAAGATGTPQGTGARLAVCVRTFENSVENGLLAEVRALAQLVPLALALIFVSASLAVGGMAALLVFAATLSYARRHLRRAHQSAQRSALEVHAGVDELVSHLDLLRSYGAGSRVLQMLRLAGTKAMKMEARAESLRAGLSGGNEVLGALGLVLLIVLVGHSGAFVTDGTVVAFAAVFFMAYRPLRDLADARSHCARGGVALAELDRLAHRSPTPRSAPAREFRPTSLVLQEFGAARGGPRVSVRVEQGQILGLAGPTGSGKTTLLRCILGLEASVGQLLLDGTDCHAAGVGPRERPLAWVPQDAPLVTGTIRDNVAVFALREQSAIDVDAVLARVGAQHLAALGQEIVGPGGRPLSGGERRLVSLARAVASGHGILLLDEPTEGLDSDSERLVHSALRSLSEDHAVLIVSHRSQTLELCERVVTLSSVDASADESQRVAAE